MKKKISFLCFFLVLFLTVVGQDGTFVNTSMSLLETNPSFAGSNGGIRNQFLFQKKWFGLSGNYTSTYNGLDAYIKQLRGGLAVSLIDENILSGSFRTRTANFIYAPQIKCKLSRLIFIPSVKLSYIQKQTDYSVFGPGFPPAKETNAFDWSGGFLLNYKKLYLGASVFHLNQPDLGMLIGRLPAKYTVNASYNLFVGSNFQLNMDAIYTYQHYFTRTQAGLSALLFKHYLLGGGLANAGLYFAKLGYRNNFFVAQISYNRTQSLISEYYADWYELCFSFNLTNKTNRHDVSNFESW